MSEIENGRLDLYDTEHSKCDHLMTLGFKGLTGAVSESLLVTCSSRVTASAFAIIDLCAADRQERAQIADLFVELPLLHIIVCIQRKTRFARIRTYYIGYVNFSLSTWPENMLRW